MIILERDGDLLAGIVYEPVHDEMFIAEKGTGAYLNDRRLRVAARRRLGDTVIATGIPFKGARDHPLFLRQLRAIMAETAGVRRFGAAALDLAYVAAGRYDGFWESGLHPWDMAAGIVLIREAGGFISEIDGGSNMMASGNIVTANDLLLPPLRKILQGAGAEEA